MRTRGRHGIRASPLEVSVNYGMVGRRIGLRQEIFDSLEPSENENIEAISIIASNDIVKFEHVAGPVTDTMTVKVTIEDPLEHVIQSADAVDSLFVVSAG